MALDRRRDEGSLGRLPPHATEAEEAVLGSVLLDRTVLGAVAPIVQPGDFYHERHAEIFAGMLALYERQDPVDYLLLLDELTRSGALEKIGGATDVAGLLGVVPTPIHAEHYARLVANCAIMRKIISAGGKIATLGFQDRESPLAALDRATRILQEILPTRSSHGPVILGESLQEYLEAVQLTYDQRDDPQAIHEGVPTGLDDLDALLGGGMQRADLLILAGRPSMGKTSFCLTIMHEVAVARPGAALLFTLEMPTRQITGRLLAAEAGVETARLRSGDWSDTEVRKIGMATNRLAPARIYIDDENALSMPQIRDRARRLHAQVPLDLIAIDHLQLIAASARRREVTRTEELGDITRHLKEMARELRVPVLALSQLSRTVEQRANKVPSLVDLRDSGTIEQDSDVVLFLYREEYYNRDTPRQGMVDLFVPKHRNGPTGQIQLIFSPRTMKFLSVDARYDRQAPV
jgi:replicative DNA helicase